MSKTVLVTGATGFIAGHIIKQLLEKGYNVIGTVRNLQNQTKFKYLYDLQNKKKQNVLTLVEANLCSDINWDGIIENCEYIMCVASPIPSRDSGNIISDQEIITGAVDGIKRILKFCLKHKKTIKRFIFTSSDAAIICPIENMPRSVITIDSNLWSDIDGNHHLAAYMKSKTFSEKYLWNFMERNNMPFQCISINPCMVIGPLLNKRINQSNDIIYSFLNRNFPFLANWCDVYVDVRDVALCHINALHTKLSQNRVNRYVVGSHHLWLKDIAIILNEKYKTKGYNIPMYVAPDIIWKLIGIFDPVINDFLVATLNVVKVAHNKRTVHDLNVQFTPLDQTIIDTADSMIKFGFVSKESNLSKFGKIFVVTALIGIFVYFVCVKLF